MQCIIHEFMDHSNQTDFSMQQQRWPRFWGENARTFKYFLDPHQRYFTTRLRRFWHMKKSSHQGHKDFGKNSNSMRFKSLLHQIPKP